ncbi:MAG: hypothetical protein ABSC94_13810 [Polyangiaceae bacterium]|jgi:tetratricopeptide (TPR) repeat protein
MMSATPSRLPPVTPNAVEGLYATGYWLFTQQRVTHALSVFRAMIHLASFDERGWLALGACYEMQDEPDVALEVYVAGIRLIRSAPRCEVARARILRARGRTREARGALAEAARTARNSQDEELSAIVAAEWLG